MTTEIKITKIKWDNRDIKPEWVKDIINKTVDLSKKGTLYREAGQRIVDDPIFKTFSPKKQKEATRIAGYLQTAKTAKGPAKFKAMQAIITTVGIGAAASLFDKFGIQPAMADTGAAAAGVTPGDIALAGAAPLATK